MLDHGIDLKSMSSSSIKAAEARIRECTACVKGKATRTPFGHRGLDRGTKAGECLHMDTYQVKVERDGRMVVEYGLVMKDMYSGYMWHAQLRSKDEVADYVAVLVRQAETQFGCTVKRLYADGGTEFINQTLKAFCSKHGKELRWTPARTQQLNGAAERSVRSFKDYERTMVQHAGAPPKLWGRAGSHAAFVWNRTHISKDTGMTPYEAMRGKKPSLRHINVWGCDAYCHVPKEQRSGAGAQGGAVHLSGPQRRAERGVRAPAEHEEGDHLARRDVPQRQLHLHARACARRRRRARRAGAGAGDGAALRGRRRAR